MEFRILQLVLMLLPTMAVAGSPWTEAIKAGARAIGSKALTTASTESAEQIGKQLTKNLAREATEIASRQATSQIAKQLAKAATSNVAPTVNTVLKSQVDEIAKISARLNSQNQRRLMMLLPELEASGQTAKTISMFAKGGAVDDVMEAVWRNRGTIAAGAGLATVVVHGGDIAAAAGEHIARPAIEQMAAPMAEGMKTVVVMAGVLGSMVLIIGLAYAWSIPSQRTKILRLLSRLPFVYKTTA